MNQNSLTKGFQNYMNKPIQYMNNQMLVNNPLYASNIYDQNFYNQMMLHKQEQLRKVKNIADLGLTKEKITEYVIAPIRVQSDSTELAKKLDDEKLLLTKKFIEENWWNKRTNAPYKNILKDQDWKKDFKSKDDLIVHKVSNKDKIGLMDDLKKLEDLLEKHNSDLKVIYSASKENEYKKAFKFVQKYKYRVKYDPKDYNELKDYYKKEQKKYEREQKRIDDIISRIMDDDINDKELKQLETELSKPKKSSKKNNKENEIDKQIQDLIEEFGEDVLNELDSSDDEKESKLSSKNTSSKNTVKISNDKSSNDKSSNNKITIDKTKTSNNTTNTISNEGNITKKIKITRILKNDPVSKSDKLETNTNIKNDQVNKSGKSETDTNINTNTERKIKIVRKK